MDDYDDTSSASPLAFAFELRVIAAKIEATKKPQWVLVAGDLSRIIAGLRTDAVPQSDVTQYFRDYYDQCQEKNQTPTQSGFMFYLRHINESGLIGIVKYIPFNDLIEIAQFN